MYTQLRWKQRYQNFEKAFIRLSNAVVRFKQTPDDELILEGLVQTYEFTYELAINTIRDFLINEDSVDYNGSKTIIKKALQYKIIDDGHVWMSAIQDRNLTSHTYDEKIAKLVVNNICNKYFSILEKLNNFFKLKYGNDS